MDPCGNKTCEQEQILVGVERYDGYGTTAILSPGLQKTCIIGMEKLHAAITEHTFKWMTPQTAFVCPLDRTCSMLRALLFCSFFCARSQTAAGLLAWDDWEEEQKTIVSKLCQKCRIAGKLAHEASREKMWELLPSFFGLSDWDELENS
jgi:hypothetical protein